MERRNELKAKARELEIGDQPEDALALYRELIDRSDKVAPGLLVHVGDLQLRLGQRATALESLTRAMDAFREAGQRNVAIAIGLRLQDEGLESEELSRRMGELALEQGYRTFARESIAAYARAAASQHKPRDPIAPIVGFLKRFPDESELWRDWAEELLAHGLGDEAVAAMEQIAAQLQSAGLPEPAARMRSEADKLRPRETLSQHPDEYDLAYGALPIDGDEGEQVGTELPLLGDAESLRPKDQPSGMGLEPTLVQASADEDDTSQSATLLEGLETSYGREWGVEQVSRSADAVERLDDLEPAEPVGSGTLPLSQVEDLGDAGERIHAASLLRHLRELDVPEAAGESPSTHYDLGVAYKEMGLVEDSIAHLAAAMRGGHDPVAAAEVLGEMLVVSGRSEAAAGLLGELAKHVADQEEGIAIEYWLARAREDLGQHADARGSYGRVAALDPAFRDASERLSRLSTAF